jgi:hypothetical protein
MLPLVAHYEIWLHRKNRSQSGDSRHGRTCRRLDPVAFDPLQTWLWSKYAVPAGRLATDRRCL